MKIFILFIIGITNVIFSQQVQISGYVFDESENVVSHVNIVAHPSKIGSQSDKYGHFSLHIFEKDSLIQFSHIAYQTNTVKKIEFDTKMIIRLHPKVLEMSELNVAGQSRTQFDPFESKNNVVAIDVEEMETRGFVDVADALFSEQTVLVDESMSGKKTLSIRASSPDELVYLYDGIRINTMGDPMVDLSSFSATGLSGLELVKGNHDLALASSGTVNFIPKLTYGKSGSFNQQFGTYNYGGYDGHGSVGNEIFSITSGLGESQYSQRYVGELSSDILTKIQRNFLHGGFKPISNLELRFMVFNSEKNFENQFTGDYIISQNSNQLMKLNVNQTPIGDVSFYGLNQINEDDENIGSGIIQKIGENKGIGFFQYKEIMNAIIQVRAHRSSLGSDWKLDSSGFQSIRNQSMAAGQLEIIQPEQTGPYLNDAKIVFEIQKVEDYSLSGLDSLPSESWSESQSMFTASFLNNSDNQRTNIYVNVGSVYRFPTLNERIFNRIFSPLDSLTLSPEYKSTYEFGMKLEGEGENGNEFNMTFSGFKYNYSNKIKTIQLSGTPLQYPINFGDASLAGLDAGLHFFSNDSHLEMTSSYSKYFFSDRQAFPLQPENLIRGTLTYRFSNFRTDVTYKNESSRVLSIVKNDRDIENVRLSPVENFDVGITAIVPWNDFSLSASFTGKNMLNKSINLDGISLYDRRYNLSFGVSWK